MCEPTTLMATTMALTAASAGYGLYTQRVTARRQQRFAARAAEEQADQINDQASARANQRARAARAERARIRALSAETGLTGTTIDTVLRNVDTQAGLDIAAIDENRENAMDDWGINYQSNLNAIRQPDYLGTALNTGLQLMSQYDQMTTPTGAGP